jgi:hypothetical protein
MKMRTLKVILLLIFIVLGSYLLTSCAPSATQAPQQVASTLEVAKTVEIGKEAPSVPPPASPRVEEPAQPVLTEAPAAEAPLATSAAFGQATLSPLPTASPPAPLPSTTPSTPPSDIPTPSAEDYIVQVEWPVQMRLGESDVARLILIPSSKGYLLVTEYPEHEVVTQTLTVQPQSGYELFAVARLDGVGFEISPAGEQIQFLLIEEGLSWRWSITPRQPGRQRLSITLLLRWVPLDTAERPIREIVAYSRALDIRVLSYLGLSQAQAMFAGLITLLCGGGLSAFALVIRPRTPSKSRLLDFQPPNQELSIELPVGLRLSMDERLLLQSLFQRYGRLVIEQEFLSGYSGARTFLTLPIRVDGRADAYTIAKIGERQSILKEHHNYETFVKDTLPPITARIQRPPVSAAASSPRRGVVSPLPRLAALQYTFIGEPGHPPGSLRKSLLDHPDPALIARLLETFGPNWWLQRRPYTFRMSVEYDRVLPTHLVIEPDEGTGFELDGRVPFGDLKLKIGDRVLLRNFASAEMRLDGVSLSLQGAPSPGHPPLRVRWLSTRKPEGAIGRIIAMRQSLLRSFVEGCDLYGLPDPLEFLPVILSETVQASQSTIHGDLNLENILVGPGGMLWLIDFAQTREGHALFDFVHLGAEIIAHIAAETVASPQQYLDILNGDPVPSEKNLASLFTVLDQSAARLLFNPSNLREYQLAFALSCVGALKYSNLSLQARHYLYLTAANLTARLGY